LNYIIKILNMKLVILIFTVLLLTLCQSEVVPAKAPEDIYRINDLYPATYSVIIFIGDNPSFWSKVGGIFGESQYQKEMRELNEIIEFFEEEPHYEIPIIEVNVDKGDFKEVMEKFEVKRVPWIVILDENNVVSYSKEPIEEADEEILLVMNIFPSTIVVPPHAGDVIIFDDDDMPDDVVMAETTASPTAHSSVQPVLSSQMINSQPTRASSETALKSSPSANHQRAMQQQHGGRPSAYPSHGNRGGPSSLQAQQGVSY
jgi:hypothetical protein